MLNASSSPSTFTPDDRRVARLIRRFKLKKSLPMPAFLEMKSTDRTSKFALAIAPFANGRAAVPCRLVTPDVMLNGSREYDCSIVPNWNPCVRRAHAVVAGAEEVLRVPLITKPMPLIVIGAGPVSRDVRWVDRGAEEVFTDVVHRFRQRVGHAQAGPRARSLHE
jgi:hypothetical protein